MLHICCLSTLIASMLEMILFLIYITSFLLALTTVLSIIFLFMSNRFLQHRHEILHRNHETGKLDISVGFFHPYCDAGGGGERVLWCAVKAIRAKYPNIRCVIYTGDSDSSPEDILKKAKERFNLSLEDIPVEFIYLQHRKFVEARLYPFFTLLGQSMGSICLAFEALFKFVPTVFIDSMGYAFTIPVFKYVGGCRVGCYVHYPIISTDMLSVVASGNLRNNNARFISNSVFLSNCKLVYYHIFAFLYGLVGRVSEVTMVNSSWTGSHILNLWKSPDKTIRVYPPCDVGAFRDIPLTDSTGNELKSIVSIAQFRPEKDHSLQISAFHTFLDLVEPSERMSYRLVLIGGCRNQEDVIRVEELKEFARSLGLEDLVEFKLNINFDEMKEEMKIATIGLHTMWNEHFGIGVVECMAAGLVTLVHDSGGPKMDIVTEFEGEQTGFLASDKHEFAQKMKMIFNMTPQERMKIREAARKSVSRFSVEEFDINFLSAVKFLIPGK